MNQSTSINSFHERNYGIDLLRLVAAFYVVFLHTMTLGGLYEATTRNTYQDLLCRILMIITFCCVNIFGIISGYVGYREPLKKPAYFGFFPLWLTVVFYCIIYAAIYMFCSPGPVANDYLVMSFFPLTSDLYWYFSCYTFVYFLAPYLNKILYHSSDRELKQLLFLICIFFVIIEYIGNSFEMGYGFTGIWLLLLYLIGGILKKTGIGSKTPTYALLLAIIIVNAVYFYLNLKCSIVTVSIFKIIFAVNVSYVNPVYLATAILHVLLFSRFRFHTFAKKIIAFAAPAAFSVYLVNTHPILWDYFVVNRFSSWAASSPVGILVRTVLFASAFVSVVVIFDFFRQKLFHLLGVHHWAQKVFCSFQKNKAA